MGYRGVIVRIKQNIMDEVYYHKVMNRYKNARVLLIDDLFKGSVSGSDINIMFELLNYRYFNNLPVIASTKMSVEDLLEVDEALGSRLIEMCKNYVVVVLLFFRRVQWSGEYVFAHFPAIQTDGFKSVEEGQKVSFNIYMFVKKTHRVSFFTFEN